MNLTKPHPASSSLSRIDAPCIVAIGGGTGLPVVLRGLKERVFPSNGDGPYRGDSNVLTAIVTVTDDGGSSGKLRRDFSIQPPGDIRNCLSALSNESFFSSDLFQYRFPAGEGLNGHSMGNLIIAALVDLKGSMVDAIKYCSAIMGIRGRIFPSTAENITLSALFADGMIIHGESSIRRRSGPIRQVFLDPTAPEPLPEAIEAIERADLIVVGPGSLYTSVIPNLLVRGIARAVRQSKAAKVYVCNIMTEPGETDNFSVMDHIETIYNHAEYGLFRYVVLNNGGLPADIKERYRKEQSFPVTCDVEGLREYGIIPVVSDVVSIQDGMIRHDEAKLGDVLIGLTKRQDSGLSNILD